jgi:PAS domain S-box-containing protein
MGTDSAGHSPTRLAALFAVGAGLLAAPLTWLGGPGAGLLVLAPAWLAAVLLATLRYRAGARQLAGAERHRAEIEARYRCLVEQAADAMFVMGPDHRILDVNTQASRDLGYTRAELLGRNFSEVIGSETVTAAGEADRDTKTRTCVYRKKDGTTAPVEARIGGVGNVGGKAGTAAGMWVAVVRDMTRRRREEAALRESERRFRETLERARLLAVCLDASGAITFCNDALLALTGYARNEVLGRNWFDLFAPPAERTELARQYRRSVRDGQAPAHHENTILTRDGKPVLVAWGNTLLRDPDGQPVGTSKLGEDVTDRKRAEAALRDSEERYRTLLDRTPVPLFVYDRATLGYLAVNEAATRAYGYTPAEFSRMTVLDIRPPEDGPALERVLAAESGGLEPRGVWRHQKKDGTVIFVDVTAHDIDLAGRSACIVLALDVTDRLRAEAALREREQLLATVLAHIPCGVFWKDLTGRYLGCNDQVARDLGLAAASDVVGQTGEQLPLPPADMCAAVTGEPILNREETHERNGRRSVLLTGAVPLRDPAGAVVGVLGTYQDITDRKRLEDQYRQSQKMEAVGQLAGGIAHDFNNLLTAINGYADLLTQDPELSEGARGFATEILKAGDRAAHLTRQLLAFSRRQVIEPHVLDLNAVVTETAHLLRRVVGEDIALSMALDQRLCRVKVDAGQLQQVLMNLVVNARDAMPTGGRLELATRTVTLSPQETHQTPGATPGVFAELAVTDTGCGMTPEVQEHIFEPFFTTKEVGKGTGLGLATVFGIVTAHGGHVRVESTLGAGTTFRVLLPRADESVVVPEALAAPTPRPGSETILLAEDEPVVRALAAHILRDRGYEVLEAQDGREAIRFAEEHPGPIDLLVTDVVMPGCGGRLVVEAVRRSRPGLRVLFMSGYTDDAVVRNGVFHDQVHFLQKPFTLAALIDEVREALDADPYLEGSLATVAVRDMLPETALARVSGS